MRTNKNETQITTPEKCMRPRNFACLKISISQFAFPLLLCIVLVGILTVACEKNESNRHETVLYYSDKNTEVSMEWVGETTPPLEMWVPDYTPESPPYVNSFDQISDVHLNEIKEVSEKWIKVQLYYPNCHKELEEMQYVGWIFNHYYPWRQDLAIVYKIREHDSGEEGSASTEFYFFIELENMCLNEPWKDIERSKVAHCIRSYYSTHYPYPTTRGALTIEEIREMVIADGDMEKTLKEYPNFTYEENLDPMYT